ncbi:MAG: hypothetical protein ABIU06_16930 [Anaerolineales bacterium]
MKKLLSTRLSCLIVGVVVVVCFGTIVLIYFAVTNIRVETGGYSIEQVVVSNDPDDTQPSVDGIVFQTSDTVFCTVKTLGVDGIIGVRWFLGDEMISESIGKTESNSITSYIKGDSPKGLPDGSYHVEVFIIENLAT